MTKKIKIWQNCIFTKSDDGTLALVAKAKEALTSFNKLGIDVTISLKDISKEDAEKFLNKHDVPFKDLYEAQKDTVQYDAVIADNSVMKFGSWDWTAQDVVQKVYDKRNSAEKSEQKQMDENLQRMIKLTKERNQKSDLSPVY